MMARYRSRSTATARRAAAVLLACCGIAACIAPAASPALVDLRTPEPAAAPAGTAPARVPESGPTRALPAPDDAVRLLAQMRQLIGNAACHSDAQCRTLAIGAKACGGPEAYLVWSTQSTDPTPLQRLAAQHRQAREAHNQRQGLASDCAVVPEPAVRCMPLPGDNVGGQCRAATGPGSAQRLHER